MAQTKLFAIQYEGLSSDPSTHTHIHVPHPKPLRPLKAGHISVCSPGYVETGGLLASQSSLTGKLQFQ